MSKLSSALVSDFRLRAQDRNLRTFVQSPSVCAQINKFTLLRAGLYARLEHWLWRIAVLPIIAYAVLVAGWWIAVLVTVGLAVYVTLAVLAWTQVVWPRLRGRVGG